MFCHKIWPSNRFPMILKDNGRPTEMWTYLRAFYCTHLAVKLLEYLYYKQMPIIPTLVAQVPMRCPSIALLLNLISLISLKQQVATLHFDSLPLFGGTQCHILVFWKWYQPLESYFLNFYSIPNTDKDRQTHKVHPSLYLQGFSPKEGIL